MTLPPVLTLSFWFAPTPPPFIPFFDHAVLVVSAAFLIVGILAYFLRTRGRIDRLTKDAVASAANTLLVTGIIGLILYALAFERVAFLSMRVLWIPLAAWLVWRAWTHWKTVMVDIPAIRKIAAERQQFEKWLPKPKK